MEINEFELSVLQQHNNYRKYMCANPLVTNEGLHKEAQQRAHALADGNLLSPSDAYGINIYEENTGDPSKTTGEYEEENSQIDVFMRIFLAEMIVQSWYNQQQQQNNYGLSGTNFTQLIWKSTTEIGVGHAYSGKILYVIVLYRPRGNIREQFADNVGCPSNNQANR